MHRRYIIASLIGTGVALLGIATWGFVGFGCVGYIQAWDIPNWSIADAFSAPRSVLSLQHKALWLRTCALLIDYGLSVMSISIFAACGLVKVTEAGKTNRFFKCLSRSLWLTVWMTVFFWCFGWMVGGLGPHSGNLEEILWYCWSSAAFFAALMLIGATPWVVTPFLIIEIVRWRLNMCRDKLIIVGNWLLALGFFGFPVLAACFGDGAVAFMIPAFLSGMIGALCLLMALEDYICERIKSRISNRHNGQEPSSDPLQTGLD